MIDYDFSSNFKSGEYKLTSSDLQEMNTKLQKIKDFVTNSNTKTFKIIIHSSESKVRSNYKEGELAKLRAEEALRIIIDYNTGGTFKRVLDPKVGDTPWDHWHLVHLHAKRRFGWTEAQGNTLMGGCPLCHLECMHRLGLQTR